jgi:hypothetical protein
MIAFVLADAHNWIGEAALNLGENVEARRHLSRSLRYRPWQPREAGLLLVALLPARYAQLLRAAYRQVKRTSSARRQCPTLLTIRARSREQSRPHKSCGWACRTNAGAPPRRHI